MSTAPKKEKLLLTIERSALDDCLFAAVQEMIDELKLPMSHRQKLRVADQISEGVMKLVDAESIPTPKAARTPAKRRTKAEMEAARKALPGIPDSGIQPAPFGAKAA
jgi:hypothetical protein